MPSPITRASLRGRSGRRVLIGGLGALLLTLPGQRTAHSMPAHDNAGTRWTATWTASPTAAAATGLSATGLNDQTVRNVVHTSAGGWMLRVRLTNRYGDRPVTFDDVAVGIADGAALGHGVRITFGGRPAVTIPAGADVASDAVRLAVGPQENLAVSLHTPGPTGPASWHSAAHTTSYVAAGDHAGDPSGDAFTTQVTSWYFLDGVDVLASPRNGAVVALGDSITDGTGTALDSNTRWTDDLARRIDDAPPGRRASVVNAGIGGNEVTLDRQPPYFGVAALRRLDADVLAQPGVSAVIVFEGVNDLTASAVPATQLIAGLRQVADRVHAARLPVIGATITPCGGYPVCGAQVEEQRQLVNTWIRTSGTFDTVLDFDSVVRDPAQTDVLRAEFDSGDHLHPNAAAYQAMADTIDLRTLTHRVGADS
ncbi:SGNH/GDSL hydrolase family protein [Actinoallomurus acaciae]|uniref:SGNH/GDSL hydrolase family protein n=1 Tax=Actinoallomurus acaciae TaxID=502577 RepID=A0ABV5YN41_9ACTN